MDGPEPTTQVFECIPTEDLVQLENAADEADVVVENLKSKDWQQAFSSLTAVRQLAKYNADFVSPIMSAVLEAVLKSIKSPRSVLSKAALMASADLFAFAAAATAIDIEDVPRDMLLQLLLKAAQDKKFLSDEAERALSCMVKGLPTLAALRLLEPYCKHSNPRVRAKATSTLALWASLLTPKEADEYGFASLLKLAAKQLTDQLPDAREGARKLANHLKRLYMESRTDESAVAVTRNSTTNAPSPLAVRRQTCPNTCSDIETVEAVAKKPRVSTPGKPAGITDTLFPEPAEGKENLGAPETRHWKSFCQSTLPVTEAASILGLSEVNSS